MGEKVGRQRAMLADGHLLLILHRPPKTNEDERYGRLFWRKPDGSWQSNELGGGAIALGRHVGEFADAIERYDRRHDEAQSVADRFTVQEAVSPLARAARNLYATLQDAREKVPADRDLINSRDRAYEIDRSADLLQQDVQNALQFAVAKKAEEQAEAAHQMAVSAHRLNMLAAFFFPIATLTAVFGTNLAHPLEQWIPPPYAFVAVVGAGLLLGCFLAAYLVSLSRRGNNRRLMP
jgi:Mg2+ and Co2+ transporter CorA